MVTKPLRVLIVENESRGHWHYAVSLARALARRAVDVRLATLLPYERLEGIEEIPVSIIGPRPQSFAGLSWHSHRRVLDHLEKIRGLIRVILEFRPNIVHLHAAIGRLDFLYCRLVKLLGPCVICTAHHLMLDAFDRMRFRAADFILVHSLNTIEGLRNYGIDKSRIVQIPHISPAHLIGSGVLPREDAKASLDLPAGAQVVLFFGHIAPHKGLDLLIDAHAMVSRDHPHVYLIIAGEPIGDFTLYQERIVEAGLSARVIQDLRYVPFERMQVYFSAADVVALPYRWIYQSGVLQWAYAFGRPVVVTDVGGIREAVVADGTGVVAAPNAEAIARATLSLLSNGKLASAMGDRALLAARTKYSWDVVSEKVLGIYQELVSVTPTSGAKGCARDERTNQINHADG